MHSKFRKLQLNLGIINVDSQDPHSKCQLQRFRSQINSPMAQIMVCDFAEGRNTSSLQGIVTFLLRKEPEFKIDPPNSLTSFDCSTTLGTSSTVFLECKVRLPAWETGEERERWRGDGTCRLVKDDVRRRRAAYRAVRAGWIPAPSVIADRPEAGKLRRAPLALELNIKCSKRRWREIEGPESRSD